MKKTSIALACILVLQSASARTVDQGDGGQYIPPSTGLTQAYRNAVGNINEFMGGTPTDPLAGVTVTGVNPGSVLEWLSGGNRDIGKWYCADCPSTDFDDPNTIEQAV